MRREVRMPLRLGRLGLATVPKLSTRKGISEVQLPLGISPYRLAQATGLSQTRISEVIHGKRSITPATALRLCKALGVSERFWLSIQVDYDIETEHDRHQDALDAVEVLVTA